jgi:ABC-2 type transport system ATP-binding protein
MPASGTCLGHDIITRERDDQAPGRLHDAALRPLRGSHDPREPDFVARVYGLKPTARGSASTRTLERLGLASRQHQLAGTLSGGWKQRLALAACIMHQPKLLLLDEPTAGVDPKARREFWDEIHRSPPRAHRAGLDPLHGRGRALPRDRLHRLWQAAGARHGPTRSSRGSGLTTMVVDRPGRRPSGAELRDASPASTAGRAFGTTLACLRPRPRPLEATPRRCGPDGIASLRGKTQPGGRLHPVHGAGARQRAGGVRQPAGFSCRLGR